MGENRINTTSRLRWTLCRALRRVVPAGGRLLYGASGHVWVEILIGRNNWQQVEPQAPASWSAVYISLPKIEITETKCWAARLPASRARRSCERGAAAESLAKNHEP
jgi:hypothetical protein